MEKENAKALINLPDGGIAAPLDEKFALTTMRDAFYIRIVYADGRTVLMVRSRPDEAAQHAQAA